MSVRILYGDCREVLRDLPDNSVHCVVTSPPYWGLRDYGVDGQIGLESSVSEWIDEMVRVFREVRRVLRSDGTLWLNLGDSYAGSRVGKDMTASRRRDNEPIPRSDLRGEGLKPKDLIGQPWRLAFALQADGWWLRQDIIWHKPNPMPESVRDRCTKAHEYMFLLTKSERYHYDFNAMQEPVTGGAHARRPSNGVGFGHGTDLEERGRGRQTWKTPDGWDTSKGNGGHGSFHVDGREKGRKLSELTKNNSSFDEAMSVMPDMRNRRSVWTVPTEPFKEAHFATFPTALVAPCILAGCPSGGVVLDPFGGAGTVGLVADRLQRDAILIELNPSYIEIAARRIRDESGLFAQVSA